MVNTPVPVTCKNNNVNCRRVNTTRRLGQSRPVVRAPIAQVGRLFAGGPNRGLVMRVVAMVTFSYA